VAELAGKFEMTIFGGYIARVCRWYNNAAVMVEENNHGHTVLKHLRENAPQVRRLTGHLKREGWVSSQLGKVLLYDAVADAFRNGEVMLHSFATFTQLTSIEGGTLRAPEGQMDDRADAVALAIAGRPRMRAVVYRAS
jgi:terminase large subunit-like protein